MFIRIISMQYILTNSTYIILLLTEILLNRLLRSKSTDRQHADKNSMTLIWITIIVTIVIAGYIASTFYYPIYLNPVIEYVGVVIIWIGIIIRLFAVYTLGQFFTVDVTIRQNHQLKKDGLYKYIRHPSYFASLISFIGLGITFNSWFALILIVTAMLIVFINRIRIEEKVLIQHFGEKYIVYKKMTRTLIPFIY